jgi:biofilm PGA synthesis N-glycosyltransferase PgaC
MSWIKVVFWLGAACVAYPYVVYPLALGLVARLRRRHGAGATAHGVAPATLPGVSVVLAAYNEEATIGRRLRELLEMIGAPGLRGELIVVSDGSTDRTTGHARSLAERDPRIKVVALEANRGKAVALTEGCARAGHEIIVFADARQSWASDALARLLGNFADPTVGAVSGELILETESGVLAGVGLYWRFEKWLRRQESVVASTVGVTGAISAVRRSLFRPIPPGTILDDVYWPLTVALQGYRVIHDPGARAYDRLPDRVEHEFRRKVRTLSGNFQLLGRLPAALAPARNPVWIQYVSHKLMRLVVPWALLALLGASALLTPPPYRLAFWWQVEFYGLAALGLSHPLASRSRLASAAASFVVLNAAAWLAFWAWLLGRTSRVWRKTPYGAPAPEGRPAGLR